MKRSAVVIPFLRLNKRILCLQDALAQTVREVWPDRPVSDLELAIGAGMRAVERGLSFMDAMDIVEGVLRICRDSEPDRAELMDDRNRERLTAYRIKLTNRRKSWPHQQSN